MSPDLNARRPVYSPLDGRLLGDIDGELQFRPQPTRMSAGELGLVIQAILAFGNTPCLSTRRYAIRVVESCTKVGGYYDMDPGFPSFEVKEMQCDARGPHAEHSCIDPLDTDSPEGNKRLVYWPRKPGEIS